MGLRLRDVGTPGFSWGDLAVIVSQLPLSSAYGRATHGDEALWTLNDHLTAAAVDELRVANWQRTKDGAKGRRMPEPLRRPGVGPKRIGRGALALDDIKEWLGW